MSTYLLSAVGVIFLSVIVSLLIPEGKLNKSVTFIMRLICIFVLVQPVTGIFGVGQSTGELNIDYEYVSTVYSNHQSSQLENLLLSEYGVNAECNVDVKYENNVFSVEKTQVCLAEKDIDLFDTIYEYLLGLGYINISVYAEST